MSNEQLFATLKSQFGFDAFREGQEAVISRVLRGKSTAAIFPTGAGKSLCYQLPAVMLPGLTLVVSPLLSLMHDQLTFLKSKGIAAAALDSTLTRDEYNDVLRQAEVGTLKILMISVERFRNERFRTHINKMNISLLAVDEAHCISEWGHNFRPEYLKLGHYVREFNIPQVILLTATATVEVGRDMCQKLGVAPDDCVRTGFYRNNLYIGMTPVAEDQKLNLLKQRLAGARGSIIVYVTLQHTADEVAQELESAGISATSYHAGMDNDVRRNIQNRFMNSEIQVVVATIAFGMGIDKSDIRGVIHYDLPKSIENYSQEIGRAGRDGNLSRCELLGSRFGETVLENFVYGDTPTKESIAIVLKEIAEAGTKWETQSYTLSRDSNIRELPLKTLLVYLEMEGIITPMFTYFGEYQFKSDRSASDILNNFSGEPQAFLRQLFGYSKKKKVWISLDVERFCTETGADRKRAVAALEYCDNLNMLELSVSRAIDVYRVNSSAIDIPAVSEKMASLFAQKEQQEIQRINNMIGFFEQNTCLSAELARYFGQNLDGGCGHCSVCSGNAGKMVEAPTLPISSDELKQYVHEFCSVAGSEATPLTATRYLCGVTMPMGTRLKLRKLGGFGRYESIPYSTVLSQVSQMMA